MTGKIVVAKNEGALMQRLVFAEVYAPNRPDSDGEYMDAETIQKMAHDYAKAMRFDQTDVEHDQEIRDGVCIVESFIARKGDPDFIEGAWVIGMHITNDELWEKVLKGEINGFSVEALVHKSDVEVEIEIPPVITGMTSKSEDHEHKFYVTFDAEGNFLGGVTDSVAGHSHRITRGTATCVEKGHSHRFACIDDFVVKEVGSA